MAEATDAARDDETAKTRQTLNDRERQIDTLQREQQILQGQLEARQQEWQQLKQANERLARRLQRLIRPGMWPRPRHKNRARP